MKKERTKNKHHLSLSELCLKIIAEIKKTLIDPLHILHDMAKKDPQADEMIPQIVDDFETASKKLWKDIKREVV